MRIKEIWQRILSNGVTPELDFEQAMKVRISNAVSVVGSIFAFAYSIYLFSHGQLTQGRNDLIFIANLILIYILNRFHFYRLGLALVFSTVPLTLLLVNFEYGTIGTEYFYLAAIVLCFYFYKKNLSRFLFSSYLVLLIVLTKYLETVVIHTEFTARVEPYILLTNIFMSLTILFLSIQLFVNQHSKYQKEIESKNTQLNNALADAKQKHEQVNLVLRELNHRVKNNLQMVSSLFNIQAYKTKNRETKAALKDARNRIVSIAIMHQKLYKDNLFHEVPLRKYIVDLVEYLRQSVNDADNLTLETQVDDVKLRIEDTVHVGLIVNELVTNAIKYGTNPYSSSNRITVQVGYSSLGLSIAVSDTGAGFSPDFSIEKASSFGLELVSSIVTQHEGSIELESNHGATVRLKLKITEFSD